MKSGKRLPYLPSSPPCFLGLHILPLIWGPNPLWGVDFLYYLPAPVQGIFILLSILLFIPGFRRRIRVCVRALPLALWGEGRRVWVGKGLLVLVASPSLSCFPPPATSWATVTIYWKNLKRRPGTTCSGRPSPTLL